jgi:hypothetical protein
MVVLVHQSRHHEMFASNQFLRLVASAFLPAGRKEFRHASHPGMALPQRWNPRSCRVDLDAEVVGRVITITLELAARGRRGGQALVGRNDPVLPRQYPHAGSYFAALPYG